jgi:hypothetical protein
LRVSRVDCVARVVPHMSAHFARGEVTTREQRESAESGQLKKEPYVNGCAFKCSLAPSLASRVDRYYTLLTLRSASSSSSPRAIHSRCAFGCVRRRRARPSTFSSRTGTSPTSRGGRRCAASSRAGASLRARPISRSSRRRRSISRGRRGARLARGRPRAPALRRARVDARARRGRIRGARAARPRAGERRAVRRRGRARVRRRHSAARRSPRSPTTTACSRASACRLPRARRDGRPEAPGEDIRPKHSSENYEMSAERHSANPIPWPATAPPNMARERSEWAASDAKQLFAARGGRHSF